MKEERSDATPYRRVVFLHENPARPLKEPHRVLVSTEQQGDGTGAERGVSGVSIRVLRRGDALGRRGGGV